MRLTKPRIPPLEESEWSDEVREMLNLTTGGDAARGRVLNIFRTLAHHPKLMKRWLVFGTHVLIQSTLAVRERELVILRIGWLCRAEYEWGQHRLIALGAGISEDEIERVAEGPDAADWSPLEAALLRATDELHADAFVSDPTWKQLEAHLSTQQRMDLVFTVGQYNLVSMALNSFGVQLDPGTEGFPSRG
jgi:alkylhydroperoxidase family enzyme